MVLKVSPDVVDIRVFCCLLCVYVIRTIPGSPEIIKELRSRHVQPHTKTKNPAVQGGESVIRLSLGRRLVNLLPVAQRTNALTNPN